MKTHSIRKTKNQIYIITFTPPFFKKLLESGWWASVQTIHYLKSSLSNMSDLPYRVNCDQMVQLEEHFGFPIKDNLSYRQAKIEQWVISGLKVGALEDIEKLLDILSHFWDAYLSKTEKNDEKQ